MSVFPAGLETPGEQELCLTYSPLRIRCTARTGHVVMLSAPLVYNADTNRCVNKIQQLRVKEQYLPPSILKRKRLNTFVKCPLVCQILCEMFYMSGFFNCHHNKGGTTSSFLGEN